MDNQAGLDVEQETDDVNTAKQILSRSVLSINGSYLYNSSAGIRSSFQPPFASVIEPSDRNRKLDRKLADIERGNKISRGYCNPCTLM